MREIYYINYEQVRTLKGIVGNPTKAYQYAKLMENGHIFPPVQIWFNERKNCWQFNDGKHRVLAAIMSKMPLKVRSYKRMGAKL